MTADTDLTLLRSEPRTAEAIEGTTQADITTSEAHGFPSEASSARRALLRQLVSFTLGSGTGLALDLGTFSLLVLLGVPALVANLGSSAAAITTVYFLATRFAFRVAPRAPSYAAFVAWYAASALTVSLTIAVASHGDVARALVIKACLIPVTFALNFCFGRWLFQGGAERAARRIRSAVESIRQTQDVDRLAERDRLVDVLVARAQVRRRAQLIATAVSFVFAVIVLPLTDGESFIQNGSGQTVVRQYALRAAFLVLLWFFTRFVVLFTAALRAGSVRHRRWLRITVVSLAISAVLMLLIWPGFWVDDEFWVLQAAKAYSTYAWQGYLTDVFYTFGLYLFPSPIGILGLQLLTVAVVSGYTVSSLQSALRRPALAVLLAVPMLSLPVLLNDQYPLRLTMYAYLLLLLLVRLARGLYAHSSRGTPLRLLGDCLLLALLAFWRTEGVLFLALLPAIFFIHRSLFMRGRGRRSVALVAGALGLAGVFGGVSTFGATAAYQLPPMFNILQTLVIQHVDSPHLAADMQQINSVASVRVLKRHSDCTEAESFWDGGVQQDFESNLPAFRVAFIDLVVHNPAAVLENRACVFANANSMGTWLPQVQRGGIWGDAGREQRHDAFVATNLLVKSPAPSVKNKVERGLLLWTATQQITLPGRIIWNAVPEIVGLLALFVVGLVRRRRRLLVLLTAPVLVEVLAVFLTEPSAYFMYYFPCYLCGGVLMAGSAALALDRLLRRRGRSSTTERSARAAPTADRVVELARA